MEMISETPLVYTLGYTSQINFKLTAHISDDKVNFLLRRVIGNSISL